MAQTQPLVLNDCSGGMTDNYLSAAPNRWKLLKNVLIGEDRLPRTVVGSIIFDEDQPLTGDLNARIGDNPFLEDTQFVRIGNKLHYKIGTGAWTELLGPTGNAAFGAGDTSSFNAFAKWASHLLCTNDGVSSPMKVWHNALGVPQIRNAGLPTLASDPTVVGSVNGIFALAGDIKTRYNAHLDDFGGGNEHANHDTTNQVTSPSATDLATLTTLVNEMLADFDAHQEDAAAGGGSYHRGQRWADRSPISNTVSNDYSAIVTALNDLRDKYNAHDADSRAHTPYSLHQSPLTALIGYGSYIYTFVYYYEYVVDDATFSDYGGVRSVQIDNTSIPAGNNIIAISGIPVLANGSTENYDTANIKVRIFRTELNGTTSYLVGEVTNGTTTYNDTTSDADLISGEVLYTDGGAAEKTLPPKSKYVIVIVDTAYYLNIEVDGEQRENEFIQSIPTDIDGCPGDFSGQIEDKITGGSSFESRPIIFGKNSVWRVDGKLDAFGRGNIEVIRISDVTGCVSHNSIVQTTVGVFFAGNDGFYWTDGYKVQKISEGLETTYKTITDTDLKAKRIYGTYEPSVLFGQLVKWACQYDEASTDNDTVFTLHLRFGIRPSSCFTIESDSGNGSFSPSCINFNGSNFLRGDSRGYLFIHDDNYRTNPKVDVDQDAADWSHETIVWDLITAGLDCGTVAMRKWAARCEVKLKNQGNIGLQMYSINDDASFQSALTPIRIANEVEWGDETFEWGNDECVWNNVLLFQEKRNFPSGTLRFTYKQLRLTNAVVNLFNSDVYGTATVDQAARTITLDDLTFSWPSDPIDYVIALENDDYVNEFMITERTSDSVLTVLDPLVELPASGSYKWVIRGKRKGDVLALQSLMIKFAYQGETTKSFGGASSLGGNA